jgi:hypothetical protein
MCSFFNLDLEHKEHEWIAWKELIDNWQVNRKKYVVLMKVKIDHIKLIALKLNTIVFVFY